MTTELDCKPGIVGPGEVLFVIRRSELNRAIRELRTNCKGFKDILSANLLVSEFAMTVRAVGMESEYPVDGIQPGTFQIPIAVLRQIAGMSETKELALHIQNGAVRSGSSTVRHPEILLGAIPDVRINIPIDASVFELLVISRLLGEPELGRQGIAERVLKAREQYKRDIAFAASCLSRYKVKPDDLDGLIDRIMTDSESAIKSAMYA